VTQNYLRFGALFLLVWIGITSRMVGEFLRECAALVVIFVPLELWKEPHGLNSDLVWHVGEASAAAFVFGLVFEYVSVIAIRVKGDLENAWRERSA
jgi:hypothetical protein